ncbi:MAG TPA: hypothetical protein VMU22_11455 [Rhizomicrobium sp.]|nr:hypothetical protein [Rhizomicrobium sp.]
MADSRAEAVAILALVPLSLAVAFWNGFPIIFYDTGAYLLEGLGRVFLAERSPVYSLFLDYGGARASLWLIALVQAAATAFVMVETARALAPRMTLAAMIALGIGLVLLTGMPWYVGQIEPDCFAAITVLSIYLLGFHGALLAGWRSWFMLAVATLSVAVHPSHLLLAGGLTMVIAIYRAVVYLAKRNLWPPSRAAQPFAACVLGLALVVLSNHQLTGQFFVSRSGPSFIFARMLQDRIVMRLLDDTCPQSHYRLCAYKEVLPRTADQWLWGRGSPFLELGRFEGSSAESARIIRDSILRYPGMQIEAAMSDAFRQFVMFKTGDQIEPQEWILSKPLGWFIPRQMRAYLAAHQQEGQIDFRPVNAMHLTVAWLSLVGLFVAFGYALRRRQHKNAVFLGFMLWALAGNAAICGALSNPHDRYQSRLIWLAPFSLVLIAGDLPRFALRPLRESGT